MSLLQAAALEAGTMEIPITREGTQAASVTVDTTAKAAASANKTTEMSSCTCSQQQQTQTSQQQQTQTTATSAPRGHIIPIQVDATQEPQSPAATPSTDASTIKVDEKSRSDTKASAIKNISESIRRAQQAVTSPEPGSPRPLFAPPFLRRPTTTSSLLPITKKGKFFDDDFFSSMRQDFQKSVTDVLNRWDKGSTLGNGQDALSTLGKYRQLRERKLDVENQAVTVTADQSSHKVQSVCTFHSALCSNERKRSHV